MDTGFVVDLEEVTEENINFRKVLYRTNKSELTLMSLKPGEDIGMEIHDGDQFIKVEEGHCLVTLNGKNHNLEDGWSVIIPAGTEHNVLNIGEDNLKLYTLYTPPQHTAGTIEKNKS